MQGIFTYAGYILGLPADTPELIRRDIEIIQRELPLDIVEFFILTPLPGSEDHQVLWRKGVEMDPDLNKYDLEHVGHRSLKMTAGGVAGDLPRSLAAVLFAGAHGDADAPGRGVPACRCAAWSRCWCRSRPWCRSKACIRCRAGSSG